MSRRSAAVAKAASADALMSTPDWTALGKAEDVLCKSAKILCAAGSVLRSCPEDAPADEALAAIALGLIDHAEKAIRESLDLLANLEDSSCCEVINEVYSLHSLAVVSRLAFVHRDQIKEAASTHALADVLEIAAAIAGPEGEGIAGKIQTAMYTMLDNARVRS